MGNIDNKKTFYREREQRECVCVCGGGGGGGINKEKAFYTDPEVFDLLFALLIYTTQSIIPFNMHEITDL